MPFIAAVPSKTAVVTSMQNKVAQIVKACHGFKQDHHQKEQDYMAAENPMDFGGHISESGSHILQEQMQVH